MSAWGELTRDQQLIALAIVLGPGALIVAWGLIDRIAEWLEKKGSPDAD
jgi:hypothetical protein